MFDTETAQLSCCKSCYQLKIVVIYNSISFLNLQPLSKTIAYGYKHPLLFSSFTLIGFLTPPLYEYKIYKHQYLSFILTFFVLYFICE